MHRIVQTAQPDRVHRVRSAHQCTPASSSACTDILYAASATPSPLDSTPSTHCSASAALAFRLSASRAASLQPQQLHSILSARSTEVYLKVIRTSRLYCAAATGHPAP